jgi:hypothetical protein
MTAYQLARHFLFALCAVLGLTIAALVLAYQAELHRPDAPASVCTTSVAGCHSQKGW